jgi:tetratricopeptide (TPR) repeat protein
MIGILIYANTLNFGFIRDDIDLVRDNPHIRSVSGASGYFTGRAAIGGREKWHSYRPIQMLTYALDYSIWKINARGYRLTNILLHIAVAFSIYYLINILYDDRRLSLIASLLFVANPLHTEAVTYISGRADPLSALFVILSMICYIKVTEKADMKFYFLMIVSYIFALFSRESSLILPALLPLYHYTFKKRLKIAAFSPVAIVSLAYIVLRLVVLKSLLYQGMSENTLLDRLPGLFVAIANYIKLLLLPLNLHTGYGIKLFSFSDPKAVIGAVLTFSLIAYAFKKREANKILFFSVGWFFIALAPQLNIYPLNAYMAEHWLYLPSVGFFLILAGFFTSPRRLSLLIIMILAYSSLTVAQNNYWREPLAFCERTVRCEPDNFGERVNLGLEYYKIGRKKEAEASFKKAIELAPGYEDAYYNLGRLKYEAGMMEEAAALFKETIRLKPDHPEAYHNLGNTYSSLGNVQKAIESYEKVIALNADYADAYYALGNLHVASGDPQKAIASYKKALAINPKDAEVCYNLAVVYYKSGDPRAAAGYLNRAVKLGFRPPQNFLDLFRK